MKELTVILAVDLTNKCDMYIYDYSYSKNDCDLVSSLMKKAIEKVASSEVELSLRSTFSDMINNTPLEYGSKFRSLPRDVNFKMFIDVHDVVSNIMVCDFATSISFDRDVPFWPALHYITKHDAKYNDLLINKSLRDFAADVMTLGNHKFFRGNKLYSVAKSNTDVVEPPSFGSIERFKKIAAATCLKTKNPAIVNCYSYDSKTGSSSKDIAYVSRFISENHVEGHSVDIKDSDDSSSEYEAFRSNHFELRVDDKDYLRLSCAKIDTKVDDHGVNLLASFYLTNQTRALLESTLFRIGSVHTIEVLLYSPDSSKIIKSGKTTAKIKSISYKCDSSISEPLLVEVLFRSKKNS